MVKCIIRAAILAAAATAAGGPRCCAAASTSLASTNDYYYTVPRYTNIAGRVMGETGDYSLVRYKDAAWITEAWYERLALGEEERAYQTNRWTFGELVRGEPWNWWEAEETTAYWTNAKLRTCAVSREEEENINKLLAAASDGAMTNRVRRMEAMKRRKLVSKAAMTNAYAMLKGMKVVVKKTEKEDKQGGEGVMEGNIEFWYDGRMHWNHPERYTNNVDGLVWRRRGYGYRERSKFKDGDESHVTEERVWERERNEGKGVAELEFWVGKKENWMRGMELPRVVEEVQAWGIVELGGEWNMSYRGYEYDEKGEYELVCASNVVETTNATVLVDLGEPQWKGTTTDVSGDRLVYTVEVKPAEVLATCVAAAPWLPSLSEVDAAASVPSIEHEGGEAKVEKLVQGAVKDVYMVIQLKPVTSLPGW